MSNILNNFFVTCDAPRPWGVYIKDSASPQMEALVELHDNIMFYLVIILFGVAWILISIVRNYVSHKSPISNKYLNHGTLIELIWTITPALILILIAFPSFKLLYLMDEVTDPSLTLLVEGDKWYRSYQHPDFLNDDNEELDFYSYLIDGMHINIQIDKTVLFMNDSSPDASDSDASSDSSSSHSGDSSGNNSTEVPERHALIDVCLHEHYIPHPDLSLEAQQNAVCDINPTVLADGTLEPHDAFVGGLSPVTCTNCFATICRDCAYPDYTDDSVGSSPQSNDNDDSSDN